MSLFLVATYNLTWKSHWLGPVTLTAVGEAVEVQLPGRHYDAEISERIRSARMRSVARPAVAAVATHT